MSDSRETTLENSRKVIGVRRLKEPMPMPEKTRVFTVANQKGGNHIGRKRGSSLSHGWLKSPGDRS
jgi:hypothetical protein